MERRRRDLVFSVRGLLSGARVLYRPESATLLLNLVNSGSLRTLGVPGKLLAIGIHIEGVASIERRECGLAQLGRLEFEFRRQILKRKAGGFASSFGPDRVARPI
jgi:hypothetical protein